MKRLFLFAVVSLALAGYVATSSARAGDDAVRVPAVLGQDLDRAVARLGATGLVPEVRWVASEAAGTVVGQDPRPGALAKRGSAVELVVGLSLRVDTIVPDVTGRDEREAVAGLEPVYDVRVEDVPSGPRNDGRVVSQQPPAGSKLPFRGELRLSIGRRGLELEQIVLPALKGLGLDAAERALLDIGLVPFPQFVAGSHERQGAVVDQQPAAGTTVTPGARVRMQVARPHRAGRRGTRIPSLYGLDVPQTMQILLELGLHGEFERVPSRFERDTVIRQTPAAGERSSRGGTVHLTVAYPAPYAFGAERVAVPHLRGRLLPEVWESVRSAGLQVQIQRRHAAEQRLEAVVEQRPRAGARVPLGTTIRVVLPLATEVPSLMGLRAAEARARAAEAGFEVHFAGDAPKPWARIVDQEPAAGTHAAAGTTIRAVLRGRQERGVVVPDVRSLSVPEAMERLHEVGLEGTSQGVRVPLRGLLEVVAQTPAPGERVRRGSTVVLETRMRGLPETGVVRVPDLKGRSLADAQRLLTQRGLTGRVTFVRGGGPSAVTGQSPEAGTYARRGSEVRLTFRR